MAPNNPVTYPVSFYQLTLTGFQDKDEIQKLSPSEQRKRLVEIVKKIDTNPDKYLTPGQFWFEWLQSLEFQDFKP